MPFTEAERAEILANCTQFLAFGPAKPFTERMREIADSEYAKERQDFYGSGGMMARLESGDAELLGKETAVFMPSGTMAQQIALRIWCDRAGGNTVAFHPTGHLELHEQGAYRELHHLKAILLGKPDRLLTLDDLEHVTEKIDALLIELPQREIGGQLPTWQELVAICDLAKSRGIKLHMDGARLWECAPYYQKSYAEISSLFDSVYVSFYKILQGLPGAILAGPADLIAESRIWLRRHGGNLYTLAPNAIAAKIGLETQLPRIPEYCAKAAEIALALQGVEGLEVVPRSPPTNMMHIHFHGDMDRLEEAFWQIARDEHVMLCRGLRETEPGVCKMEVSISGQALGLDVNRMRDLMKLAITKS
ncbi:MAG TPA: beta-eliminating lyase-related protein [Fimbriimonadaceae bacterium]|jgi:threonine aldolase